MYAIIEIVRVYRYAGESVRGCEVIISLQGAVATIFGIRKFLGRKKISHEVISSPSMEISLVESNCGTTVHQS